MSRLGAFWVWGSKSDKRNKFFVGPLAPKLNFIACFLRPSVPESRVLFTNLTGLCERTNRIVVLCDIGMLPERTVAGSS